MATSTTKKSNTEPTQTPGDTSQYEGSNVSTGSQTPESVTSPDIIPDSLNPATPGNYKETKETDDRSEKS